VKKGVCPDAWRLTTDEEWKELEMVYLIPLPFIPVCNKTPF